VSELERESVLAPEEEVVVAALASELPWATAQALGSESALVNQRRSKFQGWSRTEARQRSLLESCHSFETQQP
jgi:hypothetical protein